MHAAKAAVADEVPMLASAAAYSAFLAIPATVLVVVGAFSLFASPDVVADVMNRFETVVPAEAAELLESSLLQLEQQASTGLLMTLIGFALALWTSTSAMTTFMTAVNRAHELDDARGFAGKRAVAAALVAIVGLAVGTVAVFLMLGRHVERWLGSAVGQEQVVSWLWWTARWPLLVVVLFGAFSVFYALATDRVNRRWRIFSPGALVAVVIWVVASAGFGFYTENFGSYNKTWGSLSAAIVTLVWLWISALALLFGAEVNAEAERAGDDAERRPREPA